MTRERAIKIIQDFMGWFKKDKPIYEALEMAIKALSVEPFEDAINRNNVEECIELMTDINGDTVYAVRMSDIRQLHPVTPQPKIGKWLAVENEDMYTVDYYCSECDLPLETAERTPFCPNCGSKMGVEQNG